MITLLFVLLTSVLTLGTHASRPFFAVGDSQFRSDQDSYKEMSMPGGISEEKPADDSVQEIADKV